MQFRTGVAVVFISTVIIGSAAAAERRIQCSFDRMAGFNALDGKIERTKADTVERWAITDDAEAGTARREGGEDQSSEILRIDKPETLNWIEVTPTGDVTVTTVYKQVKRAPERYLASQMRTAPFSVAGARPAVSVGTCKVEQAF